MDSRFFVADLSESIKNSNKKEIKCNKISLHHLAQIGGGQNKLKVSHFTNSHTLPKIVISLALLFGGANVALAEESGGFVGFGIGGGGTELKSDFDDSDGISAHSKVKDSDISYGFVVGYKQFFTPYLGLRYYANLDIHHNMTKHKEEDKKPDINLLNYGANVDFLGNFVSTEIADFGGFIGLGIGGNTLTGEFIKYWKNIAKDPMIGEGVKVADTAFDIWLNIGLRTNIAKYHGIELVARVPFLPVKMVDYSYDDAGTTIKLKQTFRQTYNILARYTFSF